LVSTDTIVEWRSSLIDSTIGVGGCPLVTEVIMNFPVHPLLLSVVLASFLGPSPLAAGAAPGVSVYRSDATAVRAGMSMVDVQALLGDPANITRYCGARGATWTYYVIGAYGAREFQVDFGSDDAVVSTGERTVPSN
jgi:hypothetical protein